VLRVCVDLLQAQLRVQCDTTAKDLAGRKKALQEVSAELSSSQAKVAELQAQVRRTLFGPSS